MDKQIIAAYLMNVRNFNEGIREFDVIPLDMDMMEICIWTIDNKQFIFKESQRSIQEFAAGMPRMVVLDPPRGLKRKEAVEVLSFEASGVTLAPGADLAMLKRIMDGAQAKKNAERDPRSQLEMIRKLSEQLNEAQGLLKQQDEILASIQKEPLLLFQIGRISKDRKHAFIKKGDQTIRVEVVKDLEQYDEVLCHPKTLQIVERVGKPPLEVSRFAPDTIPNVLWSDIGGLEAAKRDMIEAIELPHKHKDLFNWYKKRPVKGIMLAGPPGCGKTMLGKAAAKSLAIAHGAEASRTGFLYVKGPEILNMYVGASEQTIRDMFYDARRHFEEHGYPAVIFIDEADAVMAARGGTFSGIGQTVVPMFLTEMDGLEASSAIVIIATNRPDILDPAIVREGRIDRKITVTRPTQADAVNIIRMNLSRYPIHTEFSLDVLAEDMAKEFYSPERTVVGNKMLYDIVNGAMLATCIDMAVGEAIRRDILANTQQGLRAEDLLVAIDRIQYQNSFVTHDMHEVA